jgi:hypothetical protein
MASIPRPADIYPSGCRRAFHHRRSLGALGSDWDKELDRRSGVWGSGQSTPGYYKRRTSNVWLPPPAVQHTARSTSQYRVCCWHRADLHAARLRCSDAAPGRADAVGEHTRAEQHPARNSVTGKRGPSPAQSRYQHAPRLPRSRHAVCGADWLAERDQARSGVPYLWSHADRFGGVPLSLASTADRGGSPGLPRLGLLQPPHVTHRLLRAAGRCRAGKTMHRAACGHDAEMLFILTVHSGDVSQRIVSLPWVRYCYHFFSKI